ncbi:MAG: DUF4190 domain-containing protein [Planctomycetia bacterium]|nr:DUF4190 domain-containing protein [Planctomycetia bacterium]
MKTEFDDALRGIYHEYDEVRPDEQTTDYKQIGPLAVGSVVAGLIAILGFFWLPFIIVAIVGTVFGILAFKKILNAPEEVGGFTLSSIGLALSVLVGISASIWQTWSFYHNAPPGYLVVNFDDMAIDSKTGKVSDTIAALNGKKVYIKGFMYPTNRQSGIENFTMVRTLAHCKFCSPGTNPADMIAVVMEKGMSVNFRANKPIYVGGIIEVNTEFQPGEIPYRIQANTFR